ncbi:hypothetical protein Tco_0238601 [Tanacetum coccineum]
MASNIKNFKCLIHFNETQRGSILSEYLTYSKLHEMVMQKFNLEANAVIKLSFKLSSFDSVVDITDDAEALLDGYTKLITLPSNVEWAEQGTHGTTRKPSLRIRFALLGTVFWYLIVEG